MKKNTHKIFVVVLALFVSSPLLPVFAQTTDQSTYDSIYGSMNTTNSQTTGSSPASPTPTSGSSPTQTVPLSANPNPTTGSSPTSPNQTTGSSPSSPTPSTGSSPAVNTFYLQNPLDPKFNSVGDLVKGALEIFSYLVVIFAVLMLIYVGLQFVLAQGNPNKMNELKSWLLWIVVGVAIVIGARIIVTVVINTLEDTKTVSPGIIETSRNALQTVSPQ